MIQLGRRVEDAKQFVRHLFEMGGTDADTATACLLALDRRAKETSRSGRVVQRRRKADWRRGEAGTRGVKRRG